jgi:hypothetical protein
MPSAVSFCIRSEAIILHYHFKQQAKNLPKAFLFMPVQNKAKKNKAMRIQPGAFSLGC